VAQQEFSVYLGFFLRPVVPMVNGALVLSLAC
jgi:hypothetical protein